MLTGHDDSELVWHAVQLFLECRRALRLARIRPVRDQDDLYRVVPAVRQRVFDSIGEEAGWSYAALAVQGSAQLVPVDISPPSNHCPLV